MENANRIIVGDSRVELRRMPPNSVDCVVTSPPYFGLRDYGMASQIGRERTVDAYVAQLASVMDGVMRVLKPTGTLWLNLGDTYATHGAGGGMGKNAQRNGANPKPYSQKRAVGLLKPKDLIGVPWRVALELQRRGWYLRNDIIWEKPNCLPEAVTDRFTRSHEYLFLFSRSPRYHLDQDAVREPWVVRPNDISRALSGHRGYKGKNGKTGQSGVKGQPVGDPSKGRNRRTVWRITTTPYRGAHFAVFPEEIPRLCIAAGCPRGGVVLDPFAGSGTTLAVARKMGRRYVGIELNPEYAKLARQRVAAASTKSQSLKR